MKTHKFKNSSSIASCSHDPDKDVLSITFQSGKTYHYGDCGYDDWARLVDSQSPGKHFAQHIKPHKGLYQP